MNPGRPGPVFGCLAAVAAVCVLATPSAVAADSAQDRKPIYDEKADAPAVIARAVARAKKDNRRVLIVYGANWCGWCYKLHDVFAKDRNIRKTLSYEYEVVRVDVGRFDRNMDLAEGYGAKIRGSGIPYLTVLGADGRPLVHQNTGSLEAGAVHDTAKVLKFLEKWAAKPLDAEKVLEDALARAGKETKRVLVHLGAPW